MLRGFSAAERAVALQAATSDTIRTGVARVARGIGEEVKLKIGDIKAAIDSKKGSYRDPTGSITITRDKQFWLSQFLSATQARPRVKKTKRGTYVLARIKGGVKVSVRRKGTPQYPTTEVHPHAWVGYAFAPKAGVFERFGPKVAMTKGRYAGKMKQKIRRKRGPTPLGVLLNAKGTGAATLLAETLENIGDVYLKNVASQVSRIVGGQVSRAQLARASKAVGPF